MENEGGVSSTSELILYDTVVAETPQCNKTCQVLSGSISHNACCKPQADHADLTPIQGQITVQSVERRLKSRDTEESWREEPGCQSGQTYCFKP